MKEVIDVINQFENVEVDEYYKIVIIRGYDWNKFNEVRRLCEARDVCAEIDTMYKELKLIIYF